MQHVRRIQTVFFALLLCVALPFTVQAQTTVASDNGDNYASGGDYTSSNGGTGFANAFTSKNLF